MAATALRGALGVVAVALFALVIIHIVGDGPPGPKVRAIDPNGVPQWVPKP